MKSQNWLGKLWNRMCSGLVADVPPNLEECESCREIDCTQERWQSCERRLGAEAGSLVATPPSSATGDLLPRVPFTVVLPPPSEPEREDPLEHDEDARPARKMSN